MRVAFRSLGRLSIGNINQALTNVVKFRQQVASGRSFSLPSEDPIGAQRAVKIGTEISQVEQYRENNQAALLYLEASQASLLDVGERLREAKSIGLSQINATSDSGSREAVATAVRSIRDHIMNLMNVQVRGRYLFSGQATTSPAFSEDANGNVRYDGDEGDIPIRVGPGQSEISNVTGSAVVGTGQSLVVSSMDWEPRISGATLLSVLNNGSGVPEGQFEIVDNLGGTATIDTTGMSTVSDVLAAINGSGLNVIAGVNGTQDGLQIFSLTPGGSIAVNELGGGATASALGIGGSALGTMVGDDLNPVLDLTTPLSDITALPTPLGSISVTVDGVTSVVDFGAAPTPFTVAALMGRFNSTIPALQMELTPDQSSIQITGDVEFSIGENLSGLTASQLGLAGSSVQGRLFGSLEALEQALLNDDTVAMERAVAEIELVIDNTVVMQGTVAARMNRLESGFDLLENYRLNAETRLGEVQAADVAEAITALSEAEGIYQTALGTASTIYSLNLFNYIYR